MPASPGMTAKASPTRQNGPATNPIVLTFVRMERTFLRKINSGKKITPRSQSPAISQIWLCHNNAQIGRTCRATLPRTDRLTPQIIKFVSGVFLFSPSMGPAFRHRRHRCISTIEPRLGTP
jgi:hypothetical protein